MASVHYSNILLIANDGTPLVTISKKKADWYLKKNLGFDCDPIEGYKRVVQLNFIPKKITHNKTLTSVKEYKKYEERRSNGTNVCYY